MIKTTPFEMVFIIRDFMYEILHRIFADQKAGAIFTCF